MKFLRVHAVNEDGVKQVFGQGLRKMRQQTGISQEDLADLADLHRTYISDIERGSRNVSLVNLVRLAQALKITPAELLKPLGNAHISKRRSIC